MKKLSVLNAQGEKLVGILHQTNSNYLVILCHGRMCNKDQHFFPTLCDNLSKHGFSTFRFDFSGNGESEGVFEDATITKEIEDIKSVIDFFEEKGYSIFSLIGLSKGAVDVLLHQAKYNSAKSVVDIAGRVNQEYETSKLYSKEQIEQLEKTGYFIVEYQGKQFEISKKYFYDRLQYGDIREAVRKIHCPVLVVHGTKDEDTPHADSELLIKSLNKESKLVLVDGAGHFFTGSSQTVLIGHITNFLKSIGSK